MQQLENIQNFLDKFNRSSGLTTLTATTDFVANTSVFCPKGDLPDLIQKTRLPFDKNLCFWSKRNYKDKKKESNMFPRYINLTIVLL
jgi:hypothetical protein